MNERGDARPGLGSPFKRRSLAGERMRELYLGAALVGVIALTVLVESASAPVTRPEVIQVTESYVERATFCPPTVDEDGANGSFAVASASGDATPIDFETARGPLEESPPPPGFEELDAGSFTARRSKEGAASNVVGYGEHVVAGAAATFESPAEGAASARCSESASDSWYFPAGSSELGFDERILLYNPSADEAVASVSFFTPSGDISRASLNDVAVPSGSWTEIEVNDFVNTQRLLSAKVEVERGRIIAWRALFAKPEGEQRGVSLSLGATEPSNTWYFPEGFVGSDAGETLTILNPGSEESTANVSLFSSKGNLRLPQDLLQITLEPETSRNVSLSKVESPTGAELEHVSAVVTASEGAEIVVERTLSLAGVPYEGVAMEVGLTRRSTRWLLPPPIADSAANTLALYNPTGTTATVDISLLSEEGLQTRDSLSNLKIKPGRRRQTFIARDESLFVAVESDAPIVAERLSYSGADIADTMGQPVTVPPK
ncbi:MAG: DUF5719 family protein [Actinomycetota bacterium]|nr:DUF5719 family protein [Actinomycetota bacterium]